MDSTPDLSASPYAHLHEATRRVMELSDKERIDYISADRWVPYLIADDAVQSIDDWIGRPRKKRPQCIWVAGRSGNGKSYILDRIVQRHPIETHHSGSSIVVPVLRIETPPSAGELACCAGICNILNKPVKSGSRIDDWRCAAEEALKAAQVRVLIYDEINSLLSGSISKRREFLFTLKYFSNALKINLVFAGTPESLSLVHLSDQIDNRFKIKPLLPWTLGKRYRQLLADFETLLPLKKPSGLSTKAMSEKISSFGLNTIGSISLFLDAAAELAIANGVEQITEEILDMCRPISRSDVRALSRRL